MNNTKSTNPFERLNVGALRKPAKSLTIQDIMPKADGICFGVMISDMSIRLGGVLADINNFSCLFKSLNTSYSESSLLEIRKNNIIIEGDISIPCEIRPFLVSDAETVYIRCEDSSETYNWTLDSSIISTNDIIGHLSHDIGVYYMANTDAKWMLMFRDDEPFIYIAADSKMITEMSNKHPESLMLISNNYLLNP